MTIVNAPALYDRFTIRPVMDPAGLFPCYDDATFWASYEPKLKERYLFYRALMQQPPVLKVGDRYVVTRLEKVRWSIRKALVRMGII